MLIQPWVLQENNVLRIQAREIDGNIDNFIIDNLVVVFKTRRGPGPGDTTSFPQTAGGGR